MRALLLLLAAAAMALAVWLLAGDEAAREAGPADDAGGAAGSREAPSLAATAPEPAVGPAPSSAAPTPASPRELVAHPRMLRGRVTGMPASAAPAMEVTVAGLPGSWAPAPLQTRTCGVGADLRFALDVRDLRGFPGMPAPALLEVRVDHPDCLPASTRLDCTGSSDETWEVTLALEPAAVATGRVVDEGGAPVAEADVAAFAMRDGAPAVGHVMPVPALHTVRTDAEGRYRLRVPGSGAFAIAASVPARQPASRVATLERGAAREVEALVLRDGLVLEGTAVHDGTRLRGAQVRATPIAGDRPWGGLFTVGRRMLAWRAGRMEPTEVLATTDEEGSFRLSGLAPGPWAVRLGGRIEGFELVTAACFEAGSRAVTLPHGPVDLTLPGALLVVRVTGEGLAPREVSLALGTSSWSTSCTPGRDGLARVLDAPEAERSLTVSAPGRRTRSQAVRTPALGATRRVEVDLEREAPRPALVIRLVGAELGLPIPRAELEVRPAEADDTGDGAVQRVEEAGDGVYRLEGLRPGRARLRVLPWGASMDDTGYGLPIERDLDLPAEGELHVELAARRGGRLRVAARDADGALLGARCTLRDADGAEVPVNWLTRGGNVAMSIPGALGTLSPALCEPPVPAGAYTLTLEHEGRTRTVEVAVVAGRTTPVEVRLVD